MKKLEIYELAVIGIRAEIDRLEKDISQGRKFLKQYENGEKPITKKTPYEIQQIIHGKKEEIEELTKKRIELQFDMEEMQ